MPVITRVIHLPINCTQNELIFAVSKALSDDEREVWRLASDRLRADPESFRKMRELARNQYGISVLPGTKIWVPLSAGACPGCGESVNCESETPNCPLGPLGCMCGRQPEECEHCHYEPTDPVNELTFTYNAESRMFDCDNCGGANLPEPLWAQSRTAGQETIPRELLPLELTCCLDLWHNKRRRQKNDSLRCPTCREFS